MGSNPPPYSTAGGRIVHARVQRINEPDSGEIRGWDALKRIAVKQVTAEEGERYCDGAGLR